MASVERVHILATDLISGDGMRILILTSSTGGGHDTRARSLKAWMEKLTDWEVKIHQTLESTHPLYAFGVRLYNWIQRNQPRLHHIYFRYLEIAGMHRKAERIAGAKRFRALLNEFRPDRVVSTHGHLNHGYFHLAKETLRNPVPCITLCTEFNGGYGFSKHWVNPDADLFIGGTAETIETAKSLGMPPAKSFLGGFMLRPRFFEPPLKADQRSAFLSSNFHFDPTRFTLLLATGAAGANNHLAFLKALSKRGKPIQVVALCGNNSAAMHRIARWTDPKQAVSMTPLAYWEDMPSLLQSVSAIVTRPGASTLSECILCGTPILFNGLGGIMPQESLNVRYGMAHGISQLLRTPADLCRSLDEWEENPSQLQSIRSNLEKVVPAQHPREIIDRINDA